jgi:hypothetical protein
VTTFLVVVRSVLALYAAVGLWIGAEWLALRLARRAHARHITRITRKGDQT